MKRKQELYWKIPSGFILLFLLGVIFISCSKKSDSQAFGYTGHGLTISQESEAFTEDSEGYFGDVNRNRTYNDQTTSVNITLNNAGTSTPTPKNLKIIKTGSIQFEVDQLAAAKTELNYLVNKYEAYYAKEELDQQSYQKVYQLAIRIPSKHYEHFLQDLEKKNLGKLLDKRIESQDVSEEYTDLETRLKNKRSYIERYTALLKQAKSMDDILKIQEKIRVLEEEIDRSAGRLRFLSDRVSMGSLNVMLRQNIETERVEIEEPTFWDRFAKSLGHGWGGVQDFILVLTAFWPLVIGAIVIFFLLRRWRRKRKNKKA